MESTNIKHAVYPYKMPYSALAESTGSHFWWVLCKTVNNYLHNDEQPLKFSDGLLIIYQLYKKKSKTENLDQYFYKTGIYRAFFH